jgi:hypothetical protein
MPFSAYVDLSEGSMISARRGKPNEWRRRALADWISRDPASVPDTTLDRLLATRMAAVSDAPRVPMRFPALLWSTRHATPAAQSVLSEYLASHGYVVAWMRYAGEDSLPPPFDNVSAARKVATLEAHVADMEWALSQLASHPSVDSGRLGVMAWSYSGEPATVLAQRTPRVRLLVSLSSNVFTPTYRTIDVTASLDSLPLRADVALLEETGAVRATPKQAPPFLDRLPGKAYRVTFPKLAHGNFNVLEGMIPALVGISAVQPWSVAGADAQDGYESICRTVLELLDRIMNGR